MVIRNRGGRKKSRTLGYRLEATEQVSVAVHRTCYLPNAALYKRPYILPDFCPQVTVLSCHVNNAETELEERKGFNDALQY